MPLPYILRDMTEEDKVFIMNSFLTNHHAYNSQSAMVTHSIYFKNQGEIIEFLLKHAQVLICCFPEAPEEIKGYVIYEYLQKTLVLHYAYFKSLHQKQGLFKDIISTLCDPVNTVIVATHMNDVRQTPNHLPAATFQDLRRCIPGKLMCYDPYFITNKRMQAAANDRIEASGTQVIYKIRGQS